MKQYSDLVKRLSVPRLVTYEYMTTFSKDIEQAATDIHRRRPNGDFSDQLHKCLIGAVCEAGVHLMLNTEDIWARFSPQATFEDRMFDLSVIQKNQFEAWQPYETKIDVKSSNKHCSGLYFAFNYYDPKNAEHAKIQGRRPGANLAFFINDSVDTDLLVTVDRVQTEDGWLVTAKYLIHRDAFNRQFNVSEYATSPYFYLRYNDLIRDGLCVKIPLQPI
jgi:hypothetical protein